MRQLTLTSGWQRLSPSGEGAGSQRGFTLLEVLIAMVVLSIGLLGVMALQANMLSYSHSAYLTSLASVKALDLEERMRANRGVADRYADEFDLGLANDDPNLCSPCHEVALKDYDLEVWSQSVVDLFPGNVDASLEEDPDDEGVFTLIISWEERERSLDFGNIDEDRSFTYSFRL